MLRQRIEEVAPGAWLLGDYKIAVATLGSPAGVATTLLDGEPFGTTFSAVFAPGFGDLAEGLVRPSNIP